jgi:hypothetical protein
VSVTRLRRQLLGVALVLAIGACARLTVLDAPYVVTPEPIVLEMLRLAGVGAHDVVYDLGSGDGRVVIAAAREFGARGVGVEIDPRLVGESRDLAFVTGVAHRTRFLVDDLFRVDLTPATVVTLYLGEELNRRLRGRLLGELTPGTRVVSHAFSMGDWPPDATRRVQGRTLYLWVVPAPVEGTWRWTAASRDEHVLRLEQRFRMISGVLTVNGVETPIGGGRVDGGTVRFTVPAGEGRGIVFDGRVHGDRIDGRVTRNGMAAPWSALRDRPR